MKPGDIVEITSGPWTGRLAQIEWITPHGLVVRLRGPIGSERDTVVVMPGEVECVDLRTRLDTPKGASLGHQVVKSWSTAAADGGRASAGQGPHPASATAPATRAVPDITTAVPPDPADRLAAVASGAR